MAKLTRTTLFPNTSELSGINIEDDNVREGLRLVKKWADKLTPSLENTFRSTYNRIQAVSAHNFLSSTHLDVQAASVVRGDVLIGNSTPEWSRLAIGSSGKYLRSDGTDLSWDSIAAGDLSGSPAFASGVTIGTLTLADGSITDSGGTINFGNENLTTGGMIVATSYIRTDSDIHIKDPYSTYYLYLNVLGTPLTDDRILSIDVGNSGRTITFSGNPTLDDWFDQSVKTGASPTFVTPIVTSLITASNIGVTTDTDLLQLTANALTVNGKITLPLANEINFRDTDISIGSTLTDGILDMSADGSIRMFYDNADVGDAVDGQSLYVYRRAAEGDDYLRFYVNDARRGIIDVSYPVLQFEVQGVAKYTIGAATSWVYTNLDVVDDVYKQNHIQVVGAQGAAVADATDADDVILRLNDLLARVRVHGLIAT